MPSLDALRRHWLRSIYVSIMWQQADQSHIVMPHLELYGWQIIDGLLQFDWDSAENMSKIKERVAFLMKGCGCKTGCLGGRCKCKSHSKLCGPGCKCVNCKNLENVEVRSDLVIEEQIAEA